MDRLAFENYCAELCCKEASMAAHEGCYGVGALIAQGRQNIVCRARNQVFKQGYQSQRHAEMEVLDILERDFTRLDRSSLTLYVSLEPCLMCYGRILLSGVPRVLYLARGCRFAMDFIGRENRQRNSRPPAAKSKNSGCLAGAGASSKREQLVIVLVVFLLQTLDVLVRVARPRCA